MGNLPGKIKILLTGIHDPQISNQINWRRCTLEQQVT